MDELLPHYERELAFLRTRSADFARRYPKIAGRLQLTGDVGTQPGLALAQSRQFPQGTLFGMQAMLVESKPQRLSIGQTLDVEYSF